VVLVSKTKKKNVRTARGGKQRKSSAVNLAEILASLDEIKARLAKIEQAQPPSLPRFERDDFLREMQRLQKELPQPTLVPYNPQYVPYRPPFREPYEITCRAIS
jgi:hypothetical protein